ncbi:MAG: polysaccharide deacetylase family protein [Kiritimatiellae bacterium]|nr:polysaccharide deacetylase family protein [Kiritimatiellia bacterium]
MTMKLATLSFDDGGGNDGKVIAILNALGIRATFYVCAGFLDRCHTRLMVPDIPGRYAGHEIGNHSWSHPEFNELPLEDFQHEIADSRDRLARFFNQPVAPFAYPFGLRFPELEAAVAAAGHTHARTIRRNKPDLVTDQSNPMAMPVTEWLMPPGGTALVTLAAATPRDHVHLSGHAHELAENGLLPAFRELLAGMQAAGYEFVHNTEFWRLTRNVHGGANGQG